MVFFTCNHCGASLKKAKVEKHYWVECRKPISVSCLDCLKDFSAADYDSHTQCITESEKYSGKDFVPKPSSYKGLSKQQAWIQLVREVKQTTSSLNKNERDLIEAISQFENVPQKKQKFINFIHNIFHNKMPSAAIDKVWDLLAERRGNVAQVVQAENSSKQINSSKTDAEHSKERCANDDEIIPKKKQRKEGQDVNTKVKDDDDDPKRMKRKKSLNANVDVNTEQNGQIKICIKCGRNNKQS